MAEHERLTDDERAALAPFAEELREHTGSAAPAAICEIACLAPGFQRGRDPVAMLVRSERGFRPGWLEQAARTLERLEALAAERGGDDPLAALRVLEPEQPLAPCERLEAYRALTGDEAREFAGRLERNASSLVLLAALHPGAVEAAVLDELGERARREPAGPCHALVPGEDGITCLPREEECDSCGRALTALFELTASSSRSASGASPTAARTSR